MRNPVRPRHARVAALIAVGVAASPVAAQFRDDFAPHTFATDHPAALAGWTWRAGDGDATIDFVPTAEGHATIVVDATRDQRNIWWAIIRRCVSRDMDLARLAQDDVELRVEARVRTSHAPRRVNLHFNTPRTTDFHSHLLEYDLPEADVWHTISMTTREFDAVPGDRVFVQLALMDWGHATYRVEVDYIRADIVELARAGRDHGAAVLYHPPVADPRSFAHALPVAHDATIDRRDADMNFHHGTAGEPPAAVVAVGGTQSTILRWEPGSFAHRRVTGSGLLELTTHTVHRSPASSGASGLARVVEILAGDPAWEETSVTFDSFHAGASPDEEVFNPQMIIDVAVSGPRGAKTLITISQPVLQRLLDGRTRGLALHPLGEIHATFFAREHDAGAHAPRLLFNLQEP